MKTAKTLWFTSREKADDVVRKFLESYPPQGYDSRGTVFYSEQDEMWGAMLTRLNSCD